MRDCATSLESELSDDELELLLATIQRQVSKGKILEIGTAAGGTLWQMVKAVEGYSIFASFVVLDPMKYFPDQLGVVRENLFQHGVDPDRIDFRQQYSADAFVDAHANKEEFDFIFVDGNHKCRYVMQDLNWLSLLKVNGFVAFHDYGKAHKGVKRAVDRFMKKNPNYIKRALTRELCMIEKVGPSLSVEVSSVDLFLAKVYTFLYQMEKSTKKRLGLGG